MLLPAASFCDTISNMNKPNQAGQVNLLVIPLVLVTLILFGVAGFAYYAYGQSEHYKNDVDAIVGTAVDKAKQQVSDQKDKDFAEKSKFPYNQYNGPDEYGSIKILYPKTWSGYVAVAQASSGKAIDGYFMPGQVPSISDSANSFALRVTIVSTAYDNIMKTFQSNTKSGKVTVQPYKSPNIPGIIGSRVDGEVVSKKQGSMIVMPFRDKTLQLWTESKDYQADFNNIVLPNFSLTP